ncbi:hypothetical protein INR49_029933 [Caranx melampygus]|nr:hypothetical protein INR49_029933 [Caranx melampygus]
MKDMKGRGMWERTAEESMIRLAIMLLQMTGRSNACFIVDVRGDQVELVFLSQLAMTKVL